MEVKDYVHDKDRKKAIIWIENVEESELVSLLLELGAENQEPKRPKISDDDQAVLDAI